MKTLTCRCGQTLFYNNTRCQNCDRTLAFDPVKGEMLSCDAVADDTYQTASGQHFQLCANRREFGVCNGMVVKKTPADSGLRCLSCAFNRTIPDVSRSENLQRWRRLEQAKRRMIAGLYALGLDVVPQVGNSSTSLRFDFLEDQRTHPNSLETFVSTGHHEGVVTINLLEADEVQRVWQKETSSERYRTLLGHFRHEVGHYFYNRLPIDPSAFLAMFGDPNRDYAQALQTHYDQGATSGWEQTYISAYASSHPMEDWAECFAHYLHMQDALETAAARGLIPALETTTALNTLVVKWMDLATSLNELNHSLGLGDAYPFVLTPVVVGKLDFIHRAVLA